MATVLIVEDDPDMREIERAMLGCAGHDVMLAANGREGLEMLAQQEPCVILLDLMMPVMDGFDTLQHLREDPRTAAVPVVVLTAKDLTDEDRDRLGGKVQALFQKQRVPLDALVTEVRSIVWQRPPL
jgi:CheY-like chemotaxis protein